MSLIYSKISGSVKNNTSNHDRMFPIGLPTFSLIALAYSIATIMPLECTFDLGMPQKWPIYCPQGSGTLRQQLLMMHGIAWYCMVLHGIVWYCMVMHGIAW